MWEMRKAELRKPSYKTQGTFCNKKIDAENCIEYNGLNSIIYIPTSTSTP